MSCCWVWDKEEGGEEGEDERSLRAVFSRHSPCRSMISIMSRTTFAVLTNWPTCSEALFDWGIGGVEMVVP